MKLLARIFRSIIYVPLFILFFEWLAMKVKVFDSILGIILTPWLIPIGIVFMITGGIIALICIIIFITNGKGTPAIFDPPTEFVATGPYAFVRNPMYIGGIILLSGFGFYQTSLSILILSFLLFVFIHFFVVFYEEPNLEKLFGKSYLHYKKTTNRWIPKLKFINEI